MLVVVVEVVVVVLVLVLVLVLALVGAVGASVVVVAAGVVLVALVVREAVVRGLIRIHSSVGGEVCISGFAQYLLNNLQICELEKIQTT